MGCPFGHGQLSSRAASSQLLLPWENSLIGGNTTEQELQNQFGIKSTIQNLKHSTENKTHPIPAENHFREFPKHLLNTFLLLYSHNPKSEVSFPFPVNQILTFPVAHSRGKKIIQLAVKLFLGKTHFFISCSGLSGKRVEPSQAAVLQTIPEYKEQSRTAAKKLSKAASSACWDSRAGFILPLLELATPKTRGKLDSANCIGGLIILPWSPCDTGLIFFFFKHNRTGLFFFFFPPLFFFIFSCTHTHTVEMLQTVCMSPELLVSQNMSESEVCGGYSPGQGSPLPGETASPKSCFQQSPSLPDSGLTELNVESPKIYHPPPCKPPGMPAPAGKRKKIFISIPSLVFVAAADGAQ